MLDFVQGCRNRAGVSMHSSTQYTVRIHVETFTSDRSSNYNSPYVILSLPLYSLSLS